MMMAMKIPTRRTKTSEKDNRHNGGGIGRFVPDSVCGNQGEETRREGKAYMKTRILAAALAAVFMFPFFSATALAAPEGTAGDLPAGVSGAEEAAPVDEAPPVPPTEYPDTEARPFTPSGTGTVIDAATDADGKLFYTVTAPDENVFYLVIDTQRSAENVYFLNAVTVADLLALAEMPDAPIPDETENTPPPSDGPETPDTEPPAPKPEQGGGNMGMIVFVAVIVILGGGAGWYFKIYRPKRQSAASGEEYESSAADDENDCPGDWGEEADGNMWYDAGDAAEDNPPWDGEESEARE
jgi:hypothetical protein